MLDLAAFALLLLDKTNDHWINTMSPWYLVCAFLLWLTTIPLIWLLEGASS